MSESKQREAICRFGKSLFDRGLTFGSSGNISVRLDDGGWLMTPTNVSMGMLDPAELSRLDAQGRHVDGLKPTKETFLHLAMYEGRPQEGAIVHLHSTHSVAVSLLPDLDPADLLPPVTPYYVMRVGKLALVPFHVPGDPAVGDAIKGLAGDHSAVLLANHGPVVAGKSLDAAVYATEELEETAKLFLMTRNLNPRYLSPEQVAAVRRKHG